MVILVFFLVISVNRRLFRYFGSYSGISVIPVILVNRRTEKKTTFDREWQATLWATMRKYIISANIVRTTEQLYDKATSAVQMNGSIGEWFRTTVGVRQGCLLSPTLFNTFLERIMSDALEEHTGKVSTDSRNITNLRFVDDIDALAEEQ